MSQQPRSQGFPKGPIQLRNLINFDWQITIIDWPMWWDLINSLPYTIQYFTLHVHFFIITLIFLYPTLIWRQHNDAQTHFQVDLNRNACTTEKHSRKRFFWYRQASCTSFYHVLALQGPRAWQLNDCFIIVIYCWV